MKAVLLYGPRDLRVEDVPEPAVQPDSVKIRVLNACICNASDYEMYTGVHPALAYCGGFPHIMGHECCGEIIEVGPGVTEYEMGQRIAYWCQMTGAFAEYNVVYTREAIAVVSDNVPSGEGAILEIAGGGTMRALHASDLKPGENVIVLGQGPAGLCITQHAKNHGAGRVIGLDVHDFRLQVAREVGADLTLNPSRASAEEIVRKIAEEIGEVTLVFDAMGDDLSEDDWVTDVVLDILPKGKDARYIVFSHPIRKRKIRLDKVSAKGISLRGFSQSREVTRRLIRHAERQVSEGKLKIRPLITHHISLDEVEAGLLRVHEKPNETLKVVIDVAE